MAAKKRKWSLFKKKASQQPTLEDLKREAAAALQEINESIRDSRSAQATALVNYTQLEIRMQEYAEDWERLKERAQRLEAGENTGFKAVLMKSETHRQAERDEIADSLLFTKKQIELLAPQMEQMEIRRRELSRRHRELESRYATVRAEYDQLIARIELARAERDSRNMEAGVDLDGVTSTLGQIRQRVEAEESLNSAYRELSESSPHLSLECGNSREDILQLALGAETPKFLALPSAERGE